MNKISIVSIYGNNNFGNKLQNYAIQEKCNQLKFNAEILKNTSKKNTYKINDLFFKFLKESKSFIFENILKKNYRNINFYIFEKEYLNNSKFFGYAYLDNRYLYNNYDYFIVGSDQVWNPNFGLKGALAFLDFAKNKKKIAFSASFGVDNISEHLKEDYIKGLNNLDYISVREEAGKDIVEELTGRKDVEVLVDPTMLLTKNEWKKIAKKPKNLNEEKYILNYFLGNLSDTRKDQINKLAKKNGYKVINILDKKDPFYNSGPSEFVYLEEHAELICTDSFHSCVFAILMDTPFVVFDREDKLENMSSRIDTLLKKFKLNDRKYMGNISSKNINHDYKEAYEILEKEREKADKFLKKALNYNQKKGDIDEC